MRVRNGTADGQGAWPAHDNDISHIMEPTDRILHVEPYETTTVAAF